MIPSPADLTYFIEVADALNLSRAAERLGISQPSLSLAMRRLEQAVGAPLLTRGKRGVALTQAGKQLLAYARQLMQTWEGVRARTLASVNEIAGAYTIGCHPSVGLDVLPAVLPRLMSEHPKLDIRLHHSLSRKVAEEVVSMKTDIGIVVNPVAHPDLVIHKLCDDEVTLWRAPRGNEDVLICDPDLTQSQELLKRIGKSGQSFSRIVTSDNLEVIAALTAAGGGTGILPTRVALRQGKRLVRVAKAPAFSDAHCLIFRVENKNVKAVQAISAAIRAAVKLS